MRACSPACRAHDGGACASRAGCERDLDRCIRGHRVRSSPACPFSICRRPAPSRCAASAGGLRSPSTARSTIISTFAPSSKRRRGAELARTFRHRNAALCRQAVGHRGGACSAFPACSPLRYGTRGERTLTLGPRPVRREAAVLWLVAAAILCFASELKALAAHPDWAPSLDRAALTSFMRYSYVPAPSTIWSGIGKLPPASFVTFAADAEPRLHAAATALLVAA